MVSSRDALRVTLCGDGKFALLGASVKRRVFVGFIPGSRAFQDPPKVPDGDRGISVKLVEKAGPRASSRQAIASSERQQARRYDWGSDLRAFIGALVSIVGWIRQEFADARRVASLKRWVFGVLCSTH